MDRAKLLGLLFVVTFFGAGETARATQVEVVESVPIETNLAVPGIRDTQTVWLDMIGRAQRSLDIEEFYINNQAGESLQPVIDAVKAAAGRGVQVRILVDSTFFANYPNDPNALSQVPNIQVKQITFAPGVMHAKYFIVDQDEAYVGSANFDWLALTHISEVGLHVADLGLAANLESIFNRDWNGSATTEPKSNHFLMNDSFQVLASPPQFNPSGTMATLDVLTQLLNSARHMIQIQVYEYTTTIYHSSQHWPTLDNLIRQAASRGVQVQLLVDQTAMKAGGKDLKALNTHGNVQVRVITIPQWSGGAIPYARVAHSKYLIIDGVAGWVGSENWTSDYFQNSRNVGIAFQSQQVASDLNRIFSTTWNSPYISSP